MKRFATTLLLLVAVLAAPASSSPIMRYEFESDRGRHVLGRQVVITLINEGPTPITMGKTWDLESVQGKGTAFYQWPDSELELAPGEERVWAWDQRVDACYGECQNVREGDPAEPGRYEVSTTVDGEKATLRFSLGQYFTLGFEARPAIEFKVFVASQPEITQMTDEAHTDDDKTLIVSGIVRKGRPYNPDWRFSMGPYSIALGEMFIEVCDGSPYYVQRHRDEWLGERWCPWDSYVKRVGR